MLVGLFDFSFLLFVFFFKQNTAYEMRISDWSSDVCSSDLTECQQGSDGRADAVRYATDRPAAICARPVAADRRTPDDRRGDCADFRQSFPHPGSQPGGRPAPAGGDRSEEHTTELQSLMRISYAVFCLKKTQTT